MDTHNTQCLVESCSACACVTEMTEPVDKSTLKNKYSQACYDIIRKSAFLILSVNAALSGEASIKLLVSIYVQYVYMY